MRTARRWPAPWKTGENYKETVMEELITGNPIIAGLIAIAAVYFIFKLIGVFTFLLRLGLAVAIGAAILYYYVK